MQIDGPFYAGLAEAADSAKAMADIGYDGLYTLEGASDPFLPLSIASEHAPEMTISTGIAVSFPRNPMHLAYTALDLHRFSGGRFMLGIGSQVKAHIERRFGCEFSPPVKRMREQVLAIKAIFDTFQNGSALDFQGEFYRHTLMTPMFNPGPSDVGVPPVLTGGFGPKMIQMAAEVADGLIVHPFNNQSYLSDHVQPNLQAGFEKAGRSADDFTVSVSAVVVTASNEQAYAAAKESVRSLMAFYASTPAYLPAMTACGIEHVQPLMNRLSKEGNWAEMSKQFDDSLLSHFIVEGEPDTIAAQLLEKYGDLATRLSIYAPYAVEPAVWARVIADIKRLSGRA